MQADEWAFDNADANAGNNAMKLDNSMRDRNGELSPRNAIRQLPEIKEHLTLLTTHAEGIEKNNKPDPQQPRRAAISPA